MGLQISESFGWKNGQLVADTVGWQIRFFISGPDRRYRSETFVIAAQEVESLMVSYKKCFDRFLALMKITPPGASIEERVGQLTIRVGGVLGHGVCVKGYRYPVSTTEELEFLLERYSISLVRGPQLVESLRKLA